MAYSNPSHIDVCMLVRNFYEHDGRVEKEAEYLASHGLRVLVIAQWRAGLPANERIRNHQVVRLPLHRLGNPNQTWLATRILDGIDGLMTASQQWMPGMSRLQRTVHTLNYQVGAVSAVARAQPDTIHSHDLDTLLPGVIAAIFAHASLVYDSHELWVERHINLGWLSSWIHRAKYSLLEWALIGHADTVFTVCDSIADELAARYGITRPTVLRNVPTFTTGKTRDLHSELGIDGPILLYIGTLAPHRGLDRAVQALRYLPERVQLVLVGPKHGTTADDVAALARALEVDQRVTILDPVAPGDIIALAGGADIGLCTHQPV